MAEQSTYTVAQLIDSADQFDVPEIQRLFTASPEWVVRLIDSLHRGIGIGAPILWNPRGAAPESRYRCGSNSPYFIVDGQGRITGTLAAFGIRPPWIAPDQWVALNGPACEVAVSFSPAGDLRFAPYVPGERFQIRLRDLMDVADGRLGTLLRTATGTTPDVEIIAKLATLAQRLKDAVLMVHWQSGGLQDITDAFRRHNQRGSGRVLSNEECDLAVLSFRCPGLQRDIVDPAVDDAAAAGFPATFDRRRVFTVLKMLTPVKARRTMGHDPDLLRTLALEAVSGVRAACDYLHGCGITGDELLARPSTSLVLAALFARFPQAACGDFARRWLALTLAGGQYDGAAGWRNPPLRQWAAATASPLPKRSWRPARRDRRAHRCRSMT